MKKICFLLVFAFIVNLSFGQIPDRSNFAIYYEVTFKSDSTDLDFVSTDLMVLFVGDQKSKFRNFYQMQGDSLLQVAIEKQLSPNEAIAFVNQVQKPKMSFALVKDWKNKSYQYSDLIFPDYYVFEAPLGIERWSILDEFDDFQGFRTQKAITEYGGRSYIAWFTEEIPINDGPYIFGNLPGLILKLSDSKNHYSFEMVKVEKKNEDLSHKIRRKPISTTKAKFFQMQHEFNTNIAGKMALGGVTLTDPNQAKEVQKRFERKNNPLELKVGQ